MAWKDRSKDQVDKFSATKDPVARTLTVKAFCHRGNSLLSSEKAKAFLEGQEVGIERVNRDGYVAFTFTDLPNKDKVNIRVQLEGKEAHADWNDFDISDIKGVSSAGPTTTSTTGTTQTAPAALGIPDDINITTLPRDDQGRWFLQGEVLSGGRPVKDYDFPILHSIADTFKTDQSGRFSKEITLSENTHVASYAVPGAPLMLHLLGPEPALPAAPAIAPATAGRIGKMQAWWTANNNMIFMIFAVFFLWLGLRTAYGWYEWFLNPPSYQQTYYGIEAEKQPSARESAKSIRERYRRGQFSRPQPAETAPTAEAKKTDEPGFWSKFANMTVGYDKGKPPGTSWFREKVFWFSFLLLIVLWRICYAEEWREMRAKAKIKSDRLKNGFPAERKVQTYRARKEVRENQLVTVYYQDGKEVQTGQKPGEKKKEGSLLGRMFKAEVLSDIILKAAKAVGQHIPGVRTIIRFIFG